MIKEMIHLSKHWKIIFNDGTLTVLNLKTNETFDENYFISINPNEVHNYDFNLLLNTSTFVEQVPRVRMKKELKDRLNHLESHLNHLVKICMGRS